jgi:hypothetical protein
MSNGWTTERRMIQSERMSGENHPLFGKKHSEESLRKMSESQKGRKFSEEHKRKLSLAWSPEMKKRQSERLKGRKISKKTRVKISIAKMGNKCTLGYRHTEETKRKMSEMKIGNKNHFYGKKLSKEHIRKMSESLREGYKNGSIKPYMLGRKHTDDYKKKMSKLLKGRIISEETRRKMSESRKGCVFSEETKEKMRKNHADFSGDNHYLFGKHRSEETKTKLKYFYIRHPEKRLRLEKSPCWLGGKSFEPYGIDFDRKLKEQIRQRDSYECQECHLTQEHAGYKLPVHHIDFVKIHNDPANLITLCKSCHAQTNFNRENWTEYFRKLLNNNQ